MNKIDTAPILERLQVLPAEIRKAREECLEAAYEKSRLEQEALALAASQEPFDPFLLPTAVERIEQAKLDLEERKNELTAAQATAFILAAEAGLEFAP